MGQNFQNIRYSFDAVGNVLGYENDCLDSVSGNYKTKQTYSYDSLYQLIKVSGETVYNPYRSSVPEFMSNYSQMFEFDSDGLGNMTSKVSTEMVKPQKAIGDNLNYRFDYEYDGNFAHRLKRAGERYYKYDANGNVICEQDGSFDGEEDVSYRKIKQETDDVYSTGYGWGLFKEDSGKGTAQAYRRTYTWNERNQLVSSVDANYATAYLYGQDGQRSNKYTQSSETLYFNKMWTLHTDRGNNVYGGQTAKNIYLGETRIVTKLNSGENPTYQEEYYKQYYYHSDHLGSASLISDYKGDEYQRIEYTPYGETWVEKTQNTGLEYLPYKFTGKAMDEETGLYYYGARYLDAKYSRWLSADPAVSEYIPMAPINDEARKHNQNLPGMGGIFNHINCNLYAYGANNPVRYIDPDGRVAQFVVGAITGFVSSAAINFGGQVISGLAHGKSLKESVTTVDVGTVVTAGLGGAVTGAITGGLWSVKAIKDVMVMSKTINGILNSTANVAGSVVSTVANNALHEENLDKGLVLNVGLAIGAGVVSGLTSPGANKVIEHESGTIKESFVKLSTMNGGKTITTIKQVSSDNSVKETFISIGQELAGRLVE